MNVCVYIYNLLHLITLLKTTYRINNKRTKTQHSLKSGSPSSPDFRNFVSWTIHCTRYLQIPHEVCPFDTWVISPVAVPVTDFYL